MIESLLSVVGQRGVDALAFLLAFALTALMDSVFHDKLPHDHGREFAVNGALSKGKARGSGLIFVLCIALVSLAFLPFKVEYVIYTILLIASMLSGYFDDAAETAWNEYKKGIIDFAIAIVAGVTYLNFNGCGVNFLQWSFTLPYAVYLLLIVILIWTSINVVNCTDGVDGLAASTTMPVCIFFAVLSILWGERFLSLGVFASGIAGGLLGFLIYNFNPAKVFMGDTGSLFLGGAVAALAFAYDMPLILVTVGIMYIVEALSDIIQVGYFKLTHGKRVFKMSPFHHHLEMGGWTGHKWKEKQIVALFAGVTVLFAVLSFIGVFHRFGA